MIGPKRADGSRDGLTRAQAEAELRRLMTEVQTTATVGHSLTVAAAGERYQRHLKRAGRKRSTIVAVESALRIQLVPFFTDKALDAIRHEDVVDLVAVLEGKASRRNRSTTTSGRSRRCSTSRGDRNAGGLP